MKLTRSVSDKFMFGVCGGLATYLGIDATIIRVGAVLATIFLFGSLVFAYVIMAAIIPAEDKYYS